MKKAKKPEFTPATGRTILVKIEAVFDIKDSSEMEDVLEQLQQYGAAHVMEKLFIAEDFETASKILEKRAIA